MVLLTLVVPQVLLTLNPTPAGPVRLCLPLRRQQLARGLRVVGAASPKIAGHSPGPNLQWRLLQTQAPAGAKRLWVELCFLGTGGIVRLVMGGAGPTADAGGPVMTRTTRSTREDAATTERTEWRYRDGSVHWIERREFRKQTVGQGGVAFAPGEVLTRTSNGFREHLAHSLMAVAPRTWRRLGVLPAGGRAARGIRKHLVTTWAGMTTMGDVRGRGDYQRAGGIITNLEYDTTFGLARMGLCARNMRMLMAAHEAACHQIDRDLHGKTGLLHQHGREHRSGAPDPGHTWLQGLLLVGCLTGDDRLLAGARRIAGGLSRVSSAAQQDSPRDRCRDLAWPMLGLESFLAFEQNPATVAAADRLLRQLAARWDETHEAFGFGEGRGRRREPNKARYRERAWLVGGLLLPGMRAAHARTKKTWLGKRVRQLESRHLRWLRGADGIPTSVWLQGTNVVGRSHTKQHASAFLFLEGLPARGVAAMLRRRGVQRALRDTPASDDPNLATSWSMAARCDWIYR